MVKAKPVSEQQLEEYCRENGIKWLSTYDADIVHRNYPGADLFMLVEFEEGRNVGREFFKIERELTDIFGGARGDLRALPELADYYRDEILAATTIRFASENATHLSQMLAEARENWASIKVAERDAVRDKVKSMRPEKLGEFCRSRGIKWLAVCDADISWRQYAGVDLLLLAEFKEDQRVSYFDLFDVERDLTSLYGVVRATVVDPKVLGDRKEGLLASASVQFVA